MYLRLTPAGRILVAFMVVWFALSALAGLIFSGLW